MNRITPRRSDASAGQGIVGRLHHRVRVQASAWPRGVKPGQEAFECQVWEINHPDGVDTNVPRECTVYDPNRGVTVRVDWTDKQMPLYLRLLAYPVCCALANQREVAAVHCH